MVFSQVCADLFLDVVFRIGRVLKQPFLDLLPFEEQRPVGRFGKGDQSCRGELVDLGKAPARIHL